MRRAIRNSILLILGYIGIVMIQTYQRLPSVISDSEQWYYYWTVGMLRMIASLCLSSFFITILSLLSNKLSEKSEDEDSAHDELGNTGELALKIIINSLFAPILFMITYLPIQADTTPLSLMLLLLLSGGFIYLGIASGTFPSRGESRKAPVTINR